jgi:hypothetical protein
MLESILSLVRGLLKLPHQTKPKSAGIQMLAMMAAPAFPHARQINVRHRLLPQNCTRHRQRYLINKYDIKPLAAKRTRPHHRRLPRRQITSGNAPCGARTARGNGHAKYCSTGFVHISPYPKGTQLEKNPSVRIVWLAGEHAHIARCLLERIDHFVNAKRVGSEVPRNDQPPSLASPRDEFELTICCRLLQSSDHLRHHRIPCLQPQAGQVLAFDVQQSSIYQRNCYFLESGIH